MGPGMRTALTVSIPGIIVPWDSSDLQFTAVLQEQLNIQSCRGMGKGLPDSKVTPAGTLSLLVLVPSPLVSSCVCSGMYYSSSLVVLR